MLNKKWKDKLLEILVINIPIFAIFSAILFSANHSLKLANTLYIWFTVAYLGIMVIIVLFDKGIK